LNEDVAIGFSLKGCAAEGKCIFPHLH
jgi:hypothetical protein